ncbi:hypothetical protein ACLRDI_12425 [Pseudomonas piscis]|uniref:hypothetical protein n=1 Tax=Pseudomonas piscis TaxID=2614538 RepID=UPI0039A60E94
MNYGIICTGAQGQTIIDDENSVLHVMAFGTYSVESVDQYYGGWVKVTYGSPIETDCPPLVFISPDGAGINIGFQNIGSSRKWTGFTFYIVGRYPANNLNFSGKFRACGVNPPESSGFGMQVKDSQDRIVFDSNYKIMRFMGGAQAWVPIEFVNMSFAFGVWLYSLPWDYGVDSYFLINPFGQKSFADRWFGSPEIGFPDYSRKTIQLSIATLKIPAPIMNMPLLAAGM